MIRAILFDFTQTLVDSADAFRAAETEAQTRIFQDLHLASWDDFLSEYRGLRQEHYDRTPNFSRRDLWQELYARHGGRCDDDALRQRQIEYWESVSAGTKLFPETLTVLEKLGRRFRLGLVTNRQGPPAWADHTLNRFPELEKFFAATVVAGDGGIPAKPDPAGFLLCLERLGAAAADAVYVGDNWRVDICGARAAGIQPIWIRHHTVQRNRPDIEDPAPVIDRLDLLLDLESILPRGRSST